MADSEKIEKALSQPKKISSDGESVENRSADELRSIQNDDAHRTINKKRSLPFRSVSCSFPGSVY